MGNSHARGAGDHIQQIPMHFRSRFTEGQTPPKAIRGLHRTYHVACSPCQICCAPLLHFNQTRQGWELDAVTTGDACTEAGCSPGKPRSGDGK